MTYSLDLGVVLLLRLSYYLTQHFSIDLIFQYMLVKCCLVCGLNHHDKSQVCRSIRPRRLRHDAAPRTKLALVKPSGRPAHQGSSPNYKYYSSSSTSLVSVNSSSPPPTAAGSSPVATSPEWLPTRWLLLALFLLPAWLLISAAFV